MPACEECHRAKKSCERPPENDNGNMKNPQACIRCARLGIPCILRTSRQGQGPKKRKLSQCLDASQQRTSTSYKYSDERGTESEEGTVLQAMLHPRQNPSSSSPSKSSLPLHDAVSMSPKSLKLHYGIRYLVHSWSSFALARRSFALLEKASHLASKCEIPMDDVFCMARSHVIQPILYNNNNNNNQSQSSALQWEGLPNSLRKICRLDHSLENRYIMIREAKNGQSRYLASQKFQQDICSSWVMEQTWKANDKSVVQLFLRGPEDFAKFTTAINYQISRYTHPDKHPECVRMNGLYVNFSNLSSSSSSSSTSTRPIVREMDLVYGFEIVTLEHSVYVCEFVPPTKSPKDEGEAIGTNESLGSTVDTTKKETALQDDDTSLDDPLWLFGNLSPLDEELDDEGFESFLALLND